MKWTFTIFLFTLLIISCKQQDSGTQASSAVPNFTSSCTIGKWSGVSAANPLNLKLSSEFTGDFINADYSNGNPATGLNPIEQMAKVWNDAVSPSTSLFKLPFSTASITGSNDLNVFRDNELGIYKSYNWYSDVPSSALAITQFFGILKNDPSLGSYIDLTHADIIVNYKDFGSSLKMRNAVYPNFDLPTIILHEMGHFLGLCHESAHTSIMAPYYLTTQRSLQVFDTQKIRALYLNNQNYGVNAIAPKPNVNALSTPAGSPVKGIIELSSDGKCRHYINGELVYEHEGPEGIARSPQLIDMNLFKITK